MPNFVLIGAQRCGTTSLFRALSQHPEIVRPSFDKGVNYFDLNYLRGPEWYAGHFPLRSVARRRAPSGHPCVFEASGYYMFHPEAIRRLAHDLPDAKLVAMLRDPVERAYSAWKHESARGFEWLDFESALASEDERLLGEAERMRLDASYESFCHRHHSYRSRGEYDRLLATTLEYFPIEQLHVMYSEEFFDNPQESFADLCAYLQIPPDRSITFDRHNAQPRQPMLQSTRRQLTTHYGDQADALTELTGRRPPWPA